MGEEVNDLLRLTQRIAYYCPFEFVSEPFFILYYTFKERVDHLALVLKSLDKFNENDLNKIIEPFSI